MFVIGLSTGENIIVTPDGMVSHTVDVGTDPRFAAGMTGICLLVGEMYKQGMMFDTEIIAAVEGAIIELGGLYPGN